MLKEIFSKNKNIIINTDIDGFLCGEILRHYYGCKIVGFSNSKKEIWVDDSVKSIYDPVYIDLYVANKDVICIEQHIIAKNKEHHCQIKKYGTKINPNLERGRTFFGDHIGNYYHKYPFGTVHYLITLMAKEGIIVDLPNLSNQVICRNVRTTFGQILMRADDALYSTLSAYADNANDWWNYLDPTNSIPPIKIMRDFINKCDRAKAKQYKDEIGFFFRNGLNCDGADGAFNNICDTNGYLQPRVAFFWKVITESLGLFNKNGDSFTELPQRLILHEGKFLKNFFRNGFDMDILNADNLYSYAFIYGPHSKYPNFSYTIDMPN